ncbi:MarR family winged helix-turn-helix transcriptional regulator [Ferrovibrio sp.]|uniref:MarR family winged helix-turn-helix transcriptional regulator n=1 Tax=Ferrovibrio sp. TaxID=1917215 RepID=UPI002621BF33|nr:MarR family winged helix-turn-helix transcriptional regulator [Ferrovibrio sp.]
MAARPKSRAKAAPCPPVLPDGMADVCMVLKTRRAARAVTRRYNALLKPFGLQSTQVSLLAAIAKGGFDSVSDLAEMMALERSAMLRNLKPLEQAGLIACPQGGQGRAQKFALTRKGEALITKLIPLWQKAQDDLRKALGDKAWRAAQQGLAALGSLA